MSDAVKRLVARATGQAGSRLRPRLPSRFETTAASETDGFVTQHEELQAPRPQNDQAPEVPATPEGQADRAPAPTLPPADAVAPPRDQASPALTDTPRATDRPESDTGAPPSSRPPRPADPGEERTTSTAPASATDGSPAPTVPATGRTEVRTVAAPRPPASDPAAPPPPLMPERPFEPGDAFAEPAAESPTAPIGRASEARQATPAAGPPEITIHIGRIELRGEAAQPAKRQRQPRPESNGSSLGDYLKGGGGRR